MRFHLVFGISSPYFSSARNVHIRIRHPLYAFVFEFNTMLRTLECFNKWWLCTEHEWRMKERKRHKKRALDSNQFRLFALYWRIQEFRFDTFRLIFFSLFISLLNCVTSDRSPFLSILFRCRWRYNIETVIKNWNFLTLESFAKANESSVKWKQSNEQSLLIFFVFCMLFVWKWAFFSLSFGSML